MYRESLAARRSGRRSTWSSRSPCASSGDFERAREHYRRAIDPSSRGSLQPEEAGRAREQDGSGGGSMR